jgi:carbonic anhydrase
VPIEDVELGNITSMLQKIIPALERVEYNGERNAKNQEFVHMVCESNVRNAIAEIRLNSPLLKENEDRGEIKIVGSVYDMDNGEVNWLE